MSYHSFLAERVLLLFFITTSVLAADLFPQTVKWSTETYGPDGPWQAVSVSIGNPSQVVDLLPGGSWMSNVLTPSVCSRSTGTDCNVAKAAGFYNLDKSSSSVQIGQTGDIRNSNFSDTVGALATLEGSGNWTFDIATIPMLNSGGGLNEYKLEIENFDMLTITSATEELPDGTTYPVQIGK
jgi:hypothetical protein